MFVPSLMTELFHGLSDKKTANLSKEILKNILSSLSDLGVKRLLPVLISRLEITSWKAKIGAI